MSWTCMGLYLKAAHPSPARHSKCHIYITTCQYKQVMYRRYQKVRTMSWTWKLLTPPPTRHSQGLRVYSTFCDSTLSDYTVFMICYNIHMHSNHRIT